MELKETKKKEIKKLPETVQKLQIGVSNLEAIKRFLKNIGWKFKTFTHSLAAIIIFMYHLAFILSKTTLRQYGSVSSRPSGSQSVPQPPSHRGLEVNFGSTLVCITIPVCAG